MIDPGSFEFSPINCRKPQSSSMYLCMYVSGAGVKMSEEALCLVKLTPLTMIRARKIDAERRMIA